MANVGWENEASVLSAMLRNASSVIARLYSASGQQYDWFFRGALFRIENALICHSAFELILY